MPWGAVVGAVIASEASKSAADTQAEAGDRSISEQRRQFDVTQENYAPYIQAGQQGVNRLQQAVIGGDMSGFQEDPGFQYALNRGLGGVESSAAARGNLFSGKTLKDLQGYGQNMANQQYSDYLNRLMQLSNIGQGATGSMASAGQNYASNVGNTLQNIGNVQAAGQIGQANALSRGIGAGTALYNQYQQNRMYENAGYGGSW